MPLINPPKYKLKLTNQDERDALTLICKETISALPGSAEELLARELLLKLAADFVSGKIKSTYTLKGHEAKLFSTMCRGVIAVKKLQPYNRSFNQGHIDAIHQQQLSYKTLLNA